MQETRKACVTGTISNRACRCGEMSPVTSGSHSPNKVGDKYISTNITRRGWCYFKLI